MNTKIKLCFLTLQLVALLSITATATSAAEHSKAKNVLSVSSDSYKQEVLKSKIPVLVDFYATWCGPCKRQAPILESLAKSYKGKIKFAKINIDHSAEIASQFGVRSIPTLVLIKKGKAVAVTKGLHSKAQLKTFLTTNLPDSTKDI